MTQYGYTLMCEKSAPPALVADAARAEQVGFDFEVLEAHVKAVREFIDAGFTHVAIQIGGEHQNTFLDWAAAELLPALREL
jgi:hypothetical protein